MKQSFAEVCGTTRNGRGKALPRVASVCAKIANQIKLATYSPKRLFFLNYFSCGKNSVQVKKDRIRIFM